MNRIESLNDQIFNERLKSYVDLYRELSKYNHDITILLEDFDEFNRDEWHEMLYNTNLDIIGYFDMNSFFFSEELVLHCISIFFGIEDIQTGELDNYKEKVNNSYKKAIEIIKNESVINKINKKNKRLIGYKHSSDIIEYMEKLKKLKKKGKLDEYIEEQKSDSM